MLNFYSRKIPPKKRSPLEKNILYVAIDETNNREKFYPQLIVAVFSPFSEDLISQNLNKDRSGSNNLFIQKKEQISLIGNRFYSFLIAKPEDYQKYTEEDFHSLAIPSLFYGSIPLQTNQLQLYLDGRSSGLERKKIKNSISQVSHLNPDQITIKSGKDFDKRYPLVNLADSLAYHLFQKCTLENLAKNPNRKMFLA